MNDLLHFTDPLVPIVRARGLAVGYGRRRVLTDVNLEIGRGHFWFLVGPNGEGKSTLLRALLGTTRPVAGRFDRADPRTRIGFVPQRCELSPNLPTTVREFVSLGLIANRVARAEREPRLLDSLAQVDMLPHLHSDYWSLSLGQRQRLLLARALVRNPNTLLLDEPTNGLDLAAQHRWLELLAERNRQTQLTIVFVTHDLGLVKGYASHVALVANGEVTSGAPESVLTEANLARAYRVPGSLVANCCVPARPGSSGDA
ncbi:MAG: metal ABC transporter ATP-binding protein [Planctomycetota bacterium]